jgi:flagellar P-ring protein precursor FlgI
MNATSQITQNNSPRFLPRMSLAAVKILLSLVICFSATPASAASRVKDIADFEGIRDNLLVGYGLVVGLNGSGDSLNNSPFTKQSLEAMLERLGVNIRESGSFKTKNVAAVMVTATLPAFARQGTRIDISVSALGDAKSLLGGNLLVTPLMGADGEVYGVAQGPVAIAGFAAGGQATTVTRGVPTGGRIPNGAIVEREVGFELSQLPALRLMLRNPDLTTARRIANSISTSTKDIKAKALDPSTVLVDFPDARRSELVNVMTEIEQISIETDQPARVVIDEKSGVIVMGSNVRIDTIAIAQGNLTIRVTETPQVSQPGPFAPGPTSVPGVTGLPGSSAATGTIPVARLNPDGTPVRDPVTNAVVFDLIPVGVPGTGVAPTPPIPGAIGGGAQTVIVPRTQVEIDDSSDKRLVVFNRGVTLQALVDGLNALGIGPRDMISILQTIKAAGALQAEIEIM